MAAIPIVTFDKGIVETQKGALLHPPSELFTISQMSYYANCKIGWSRCPLGYGVYAAFDSLGRKIVVPAIYLLDEQSPNRKFPSYPIKFHKAQIIDFIQAHLDMSDKIRIQRDIEFKNLTHDLRGISNEIYHNALNLKQQIEDKNYTWALNKSESVLNAQQMMSLRLDIVDYESGLSSGRPSESIAIYKKIDKVIRSFNNRSISADVRFRIEGRLNSTMFGPPIFEIVPFAIVENSLKYAPRGTEVSVRFEEKSQDNTAIIRFESFGPKIKDSEKNKIFERNFRGSSAQNLSPSGSGIGLYAAKTIIEAHFSGSIFVNQLDEKIVRENIEYFKTRFTIIVPTEQEANSLVSNRRHWSNKGM